MTSVDVVQLARVYIDARDFDRAAEVLRTALQSAPQSAELLTELARVQIRMGNHSGAAGTAFAALTEAPDDVYAMRMYSLALDGVGRSADAMTVAYRAVLTDPNDYLAHHGYGALLYGAGRYSDALRVIAEALRLQPADPDLHFLRGQTLHAMNRLDESTAAYEEVLRLNPGDASAVHNIALNRLQRGRWNVALRGFLGAGQMDPHIGELVRSNIGAALVRPLRWTTLVSFIVCCSVPFAIERSDTAVGARVVAGVGALVLVALLVWVGRSLPRSAWKSVIRRRPVYVVRLVLALCVIVLGLVVAMGAVYPVLIPISSLTFLGILVLVVLGWLLRS